MSDRPKYARRYRKGPLWAWTGEVFRMPSFIDAFLDDERPILVARTYAFTERGIRRSLAKLLWRKTHPKAWTVRGDRRSGEHG